MCFTPAICRCVADDMSRHAARTDLEPLDNLQVSVSSSNGSPGPVETSCTGLH